MCNKLLKKTMQEKEEEKHKIIRELYNFNPKDYLWSFPRGINQDDYSWKNMLMNDVRSCVRYYASDNDIENFTMDSLKKMDRINFHKLALTLLSQYPWWFRKDMSILSFCELIVLFMQDPTPLTDKKLLDLCED